MRSIVLAVLVAAGIGMLGTAGASAAPASGLTLTPESNITQVQHWRWGSRHWRWGSRGWRNCHVRRWSRWARC